MGSIELIIDRRVLVDDKGKDRNLDEEEEKEEERVERSFKNL